MRLYELNCLIKESEEGNIEGKVRNLVEQENGIVIDIKNQSRPRPVYFGAKNKEGSASLVSLSFNLEPEKLGSLKTNLSGENRILRYLILSKKTPKMTERRLRRPSVSFRGGEVTKVKKAELKEIGEKLEKVLGE